MEIDTESYPYGVVSGCCCNSVELGVFPGGVPIYCVCVHSGYVS